LSRPAACACLVCQRPGIARTVPICHAVQGQTSPSAGPQEISAAVVAKKRLRSLGKKLWAPPLASHVLVPVARYTERSASFRDPPCSLTNAEPRLEPHSPEMMMVMRRRDPIKHELPAPPRHGFVPAARVPIPATYLLAYLPTYLLPLPNHTLATKPTAGERGPRAELESL